MFDMQWHAFITSLLLVFALLGNSATPCTSTAF
jgi:hypothetical protein